MATTFACAAATITPDSLPGYDSSSEAGTLVHRRLASEDVDVTLRPASLRAGTFEVLIVDESAAYAAEAALRGANVWTMTRPDLATVEMQFVVTGTVRRRLDATAAGWLVSFGWQEVVP